MEMKWQRLATIAAFVFASFVVPSVVASETFDPADIAESWVKDFESTDPQSCKKSDVDPGHSDVRRYFQRAKVLDEKTLNDNYPVAPCYSAGVLKYKNEWCDWTISAASTGTIACGKRKWFFACDDCDELLVKQRSGGDAGSRVLRGRSSKCR